MNPLDAYLRAPSPPSMEQDEEDVFEGVVRHPMLIAALISLVSHFLRATEEFCLSVKGCK